MLDRVLQTDTILNGKTEVKSMLDNRLILAPLLAIAISTQAYAGMEGVISGTITDNQGIAIPNVTVRLLTPAGQPVKETRSDATGQYSFFPINFGDYVVKVESTGFQPFSASVHVATGTSAPQDIQLQPGSSAPQEIVLKVKAKRKPLVQSSTSQTATEISKDKIDVLPQGQTISLPKLITDTTPGVVPGALGQLFFRGNHANIQYNIDGITLPDSPSNTFGDAFTPRDIDHMDIITGGIPAEFGERLAAVVNIVTKSGPETPDGSFITTYGSYNTFSTMATYGGSNAKGDVHYFVSGSYNRTDRGLDTPQPRSEADQSQGSHDAIHDQSEGNNEYAKVDWYLDNDDKLSFVLYNSYNFFEIPNYPSWFRPSDSFFQPGFADNFGNGGDPNTVTFNYTPAYTRDSQSEYNGFIESIWRHAFSDRAFLLIGPYYKYSRINFNNDLSNDLYTATDGAFPISGASPTSLAENRVTNNLGLKGDLSLRPDDRNSVKTGFLLQGARSGGFLSIQSTNAGPPAVDSSPTDVYFEAAYLQDDFTIFKPLTLNVGLRFDAAQYSFSDVQTHDSAWQPRIGLTWMITDYTKWHIFYGRLFQPAPAEDLRDTFGNLNNVAAGQLAPYDIKAEKDNYYESGIAQQLPGSQVFNLVGWYKDATNMLDDAELGTSSVSSPFNFAHGYAFGAEVSVSGKINDDWSEWVNYSFEHAKGQGISGGLFTFQTAGGPTGLPANTYQWLDHCQISTLNAGATFSRERYWGTAAAQYGSGLRTGPNNVDSLPAHFTMDLSAGYKFLKSDSVFPGWTVSGDLLNIFDNLYPITVANGFNGSHYAAGRVAMIHLTKEL